MMMLILCVVLLVAFGVVIIYLRTQELERKNRMLRSYMMSMQEFYQSIHDKIEATRQYRHDLAKHIQLLEMLLEQKAEDTTDVQEYMEELKGEYQTLKAPECCSDEIVNTILLMKKHQCEELDIPLQLSVADTEYSMIQEADLTAMLYNLLDNAIEENERIPKGEARGVSFVMRKEDTNHVMIEIENQIAEPDKLNFHTSKLQKEEHGIGTRIIDKLIKKYNGTKQLNIDKERRILKEQIMLEGSDGLC